MVGMSLELMITIAASAVCTIVAVVITVHLGNKSTQNILERLTVVAEGNQKILEKVAHAIHKLDHTTLKTAHGMRANALMHGWKYAESIVSETGAQKLGKLYDYEPSLKTCYYKPRRGRPPKAV